MDDTDAGAQLVSFTAQRTIRAPVDAVYRLWCTPAGLESWWAPAGTVVRVVTLEPRKGGQIEFAYQQSAAIENPEWAAKLGGEGHLTHWAARGLFSDVRVNQEVMFFQDLEFSTSGREIPYSIRARFRQIAAGTRVTLTARSLRTKHWTLLGRANLVGQLERLATQAEKSPTD